MNEKIRIGLATIIGLLMALAAFMTAIAEQAANFEALGLDPKYFVLIGAGALAIVKIGRYLQAAAAAFNTFMGGEMPELPPGGNDIEVVGLPDEK